MQRPVGGDAGVAAITVRQLWRHVLRRGPIRNRAASPCARHHHRSTVRSEEHPLTGLSLGCYAEDRSCGYVLLRVNRNGVRKPIRSASARTIDPVALLNLIGGGEVEFEFETRP